MKDKTRIVIFSALFALIISLIVYGTLYFAWLWGYIGPTQIFEIENTMEIYNTPGWRRVNKNFMIINPPDTIEDLKVLVEEYLDENFPNPAEMLEEIHPYQGAIFALRFYRVSPSLPRNWQPRLGHMGRHSRHPVGNDDRLATVYWNPNEPFIRMSIALRSSNLRNYGEIIEEIWLHGDEIVESYMFFR